MKRQEPQIEILARGVCVVRGQLLLCHSKGAANTYLPGGHVEFREPARAALEREIAEEMGCRARAGRFLGCVEHVFRQKGKWHAEINLLFALRIPGLTPATPPPACEAWIEFQWTPLSKLCQARLEPAVLRRKLPVWLEKAAGFAGRQVGREGGNRKTAEPQSFDF
ncbi:MAG: NUDIX domain-containing protein [bacterium]